MYQTNIQNQLFSAALPLKPLTAWAGSACSVTVAVPPAPALAGLGVSSVGVTLTLPDGHTVAAAAVQVPGTPLWVATFAPEEFATSGHVAQGLMITVAGTDEHGVVRTWIVAKGDVDVVDGDASPVSGGSYYAVKLRDEAPEDPVEGDAYVAGGELSIYHDGEWVTIGVVVDEEISASSPNPVRNAAIAAALADKMDGEAAYPAWDPSTAPIEGMIKSHAGKLWKCLSSTMDEPSETSEDWLLVTIDSLKQDALSHVQLAAVNSGATPEKVATWDGYAAQIAQKASLTDLPYAQVTPGEWEFSGLPSGATDVAMSWNGSRFAWVLEFEVGGITNTMEGTSFIGENALSVHLENEAYTITATRASLPGHLCDRAGNRVVVTGDTTLTLPAANPGYLRDFLVRLEISGSTVPTITFQGQGSEAPNGEDEITYETDGDEFPVPDETGTWSYSFTENCVSHKFAVSLKKVNEVAAPQAQGGS